MNFGRFNMKDEEIDCFGTYEDGHVECLICDESEECKKAAKFSNKIKIALLCTSLNFFSFFLMCRFDFFSSFILYFLIQFLSPVGSFLFNLEMKKMSRYWFLGLPFSIALLIYYIILIVSSLITSKYTHLFGILFDLFWVTIAPLSVLFFFSIPENQRKNVIIPVIISTIASVFVFYIFYVGNFGVIEDVAFLVLNYVMPIIGISILIFTFTPDMRPHTQVMLKAVFDMLHGLNGFLNEITDNIEEWGKENSEKKEREEQEHVAGQRESIQVVEKNYGSNVTKYLQIILIIGVLGVMGFWFINSGLIDTSETMEPSPTPDTAQFNPIITLPEGIRCYPDLPEPELIVTGTEDYEYQNKEWTTYNLKVVNWAEFSDELFVPAPELPPCGLNKNASRTWLDIKRKDGSRIYGYCALGTSKSLQDISFTLERGEAPPEFVYITLTDRWCDTTYTSNLASTEISPTTSVSSENPQK